MPMLKKKPAAPRSMSADAFAEIAKLTDELQGLIKKAKKQYGDIDPKTKKKIVTGVAGTAALIAGAIGIAAVKKSQSKKK